MGTNAIGPPARLATAYLVAGKAFLHRYDEHFATR
jgi:hypothetical protein